MGMRRSLATSYRLPRWLRDDGTRRPAADRQSANRDGDHLGMPHRRLPGCAAGR